MPSKTTLGSWLDNAVKQLTTVGISSARIDCLVLLEDTLNQDRSHILANPEQKLSNDQLNRLNGQLNDRVSRVPLAYIRGIKEFYGLEFNVSPSVLIPRPETEDILDLVDSLGLPNEAQLADIGTGSGNIAVSLAKKYPKHQVYAYDIDPEALKVAETNAAKHEVKIAFNQSNLLKSVNQQFDLIIANLPYVDPSIKVEPEILYEPSSAIFAESQGLQLIEQLISQISPSRLTSGGWLILESHRHQHSKIEQLCSRANLKLIQTQSLIQVFEYQN